MTSPLQRAALGVFVTLILLCSLDACSSSPVGSHRTTSKKTSTTTSMTFAAVATSTSTTMAPSGVAIPNVIGMKITPAHFYLRAAGFFAVPLNAPCNRGGLNGQSVVASLSIPGNPPAVSAGAVPLVPGTPRPKGSKVGITWSGCFPGGSVVPQVTGLAFLAAAKLLRTAGLTWSCYSEGPATTTTASVTTSSTSKPPTSATPRSTTTTTHPPPATVLSQSAPAGTVLAAGTPVKLAMHHCLQ